MWELGRKKKGLLPRFWGRLSVDGFPILDSIELQPDSTGLITIVEYDGPQCAPLQDGREAFTDDLGPGSTDVKRASEVFQGEQGSGLAEEVNRE